MEAIDGEVARKVPPWLTGDDGRVSFLHGTVNRNKRSLILDLRRDEGRDIFLKLAARSDIAVQNFPPWHFRQMGLCRAILE